MYTYRTRGTCSQAIEIETDGDIIRSVKYGDNVLNWDLAGEEQFFKNLEARRKNILEKVNSLVGKNSKIAEVDAMKEPFEKTATQKIRRYKYTGGKVPDRISPDSSREEKNLEGKQK